MRWTTLLSTRRLDQTRRFDREPLQNTSSQANDPRSPYEIDVDRLVFSSAFRRLQSKMQVHGPSLYDQPGDYVRNRLTHSLEVSRVGRSLGQLAGHYLLRAGLVEGVSAADIGHVVSAGSIAHDIGQTPFSHEGEQALAFWWTTSPIAEEILRGLPPEYERELTRFEGNAFGFRLLARLEGWKPNGGLQFTAAALGAFCKYPWSGGLPPEQRPHPLKYGIFTSELDLFREVAATTGLIELGPDIWCRHPLAHLTEAADDICYRIVDIEDAVQIGALSFAEGEALLVPLAASDAAEYRMIDGVLRKLTYLRARAIQTLIAEASRAWIDMHDAMLAGETIPELLGGSRHKAALDNIAEVSRRKIYRGGKRAETVLIASNTLNTLLDSYAPMLLRREATPNDAALSIYDRAVLTIFSPGAETSGESSISRLRSVWVREMMDHIASLTDGGALREAKMLTSG